MDTRAPGFYGVLPEPSSQFRTSDGGFCLADQCHGHPSIPEGQALHVERNVGHPNLRGGAGDPDGMNEHPKRDFGSAKGCSQRVGPLTRQSWRAGADASAACLGVAEVDLCSRSDTALRIAFSVFCDRSASAIVLGPWPKMASARPLVTPISPLCTVSAADGRLRLGVGPDLACQRTQPRPAHATKASARN